MAWHLSSFSPQTVSPPTQMSSTSVRRDPLAVCTTRFVCCSLSINNCDDCPEEGKEAAAVAGESGSPVVALCTHHHNEPALLAKRLPGYPTPRSSKQRSSFPINISLQRQGCCIPPHSSSASSPPLSTTQSPTPTIQRAAPPTKRRLQPPLHTHTHRPAPPHHRRKITR